MPNMRVLDAGSMWGGLTLPVAQYAKEVFALDKTVETLSFLDIRARQMGYENIYPIASTLDKLPFKDGYFDLVILNGVLEWVAFRQNLILEKQWNAKSKAIKKYEQSPEQMQINVLKELRRVTKPEGYLFLAIENRVGYQYLTGYPDDHVNIKFVTFLPRFLADIITKIKRGFSYRTYVYSSIGYKNILQKSGYKKLKFYGAFAHYIAPYAVIPFNLIKNFKGLIGSGGGKRLKLFLKALPRFLMKYLSPSFVIIAGKSDKEFADAKIISLVKKAGVVKEVSEIEPILISRRAGSRIPLNCLIFDTSRRSPVAFCKISRSRRHAEIINDEADNLKYAGELFKGTVIAERIPRLLYSGVIDNVTLLVTNYLDCEVFNFKNIKGSRKSADILKALKKAIDFLVDFQKLSLVREIDVSDYFLPKIKKQKEILLPKLDDSTDKKIDELSDVIAKLKGVKLNLSAVHGDFDFYHNILHKNGEVYVVDFEHFEKEGIPFLDLAMLILHPFVISFKETSKSVNFRDFLKVSRAEDLFRECLGYYFNKSNIDKRLFDCALRIAVLEQNTKEYPGYRDKKSFPLCDVEILKELFRSDYI
ncbi:MAG TPA: methyltransferase domain-containing protein [Candidatus Omnitrophica bacterium]|nr:methyltransferase domain-containing protein [Candidatus Omnitrophota bacterium]